MSILYGYLLYLLGLYVSAVARPRLSEVVRRRRGVHAIRASNEFAVDNADTRENIEEEKEAISKYLAEHPSRLFPSGKVEIEEVIGGTLNFCFRCSDSTNKDSVVFTKHAKDSLKALRDIPLSSERLGYEFDGTCAGVCIVHRA
jgi:hypothetical protein